MRIVTSALSVLACAVVVQTAVAEDGYAHHLRLGVQSMPTDVETETTVTVGGVDLTTDDDGSWDSAGRITAGYQWTLNRNAPLSFILGIGVAFTGFEAEDDSGDLTVSEIGAWIEPGVAWHAARIFDVELGLRIGSGVADAEFETSGGDVDYDPANYGEIGLHLRGIFHFESGFEIGAEASLAGQSATFESDEDGTDYETEVSTSGAAFGIILGWRF